MVVTMLEMKATLKEQDIGEFERRTGLKFPPQYRAWLLRYNGGRPEPKGFRYKYESGPYTDSCVAWFFNLGDAKYERLEGELRVYKNPDDKRLPDELIPFARDPFGNLICISMCGENQGKVYFWDHEEEDTPPSYRNCHLIADSFDEFIAALH